MNNYIASCIAEQRTVVIITLNGFQMRGKIVEDADSGLRFVTDDKEVFVYKHAISTIRPA